MAGQITQGTTRDGGRVGSRVVPGSRVRKVMFLVSRGGAWDGAKLRIVTEISECISKALFHYGSSHLCQFVSKNGHFDNF